MRPLTEQEEECLFELELITQEDCPNPIDPGGIQTILEWMQDEGVDPQKIYQVFLSLRRPHQLPVPPYEDVAPSPRQGHGS